MDKVSITENAKYFASVLRQVQRSDRPVQWVAHSQVGMIMVTIWDAIEELITPPFMRKLVGGPSNYNYFKTFRINFGKSMLECDFPYGYAGCDGPSDQYNAYQWAKENKTENERVVNLNILDEEFDSYSHWRNVYFYEVFTWHYQAKLLFRKFFDTASITIMFLIHKTEKDINSLSDIEAHLRQHYEDYAKDDEVKLVPSDYEVVERAGVQWLKYSGQLLPHLTNCIKDNYVVPLDRHHFLMVRIDNMIETRTGLFPQEVEERIFKDAEALIEGVRFTSLDD